MMKNQTWKKQDIELDPGTCIKGKWHHQTYVVKKKLGSGAIGTVYLVEAGGKKRALKISDNSISMTIEVNVLKSLEKVQGKQLGPSLMDVDDWNSQHRTHYSFYVMEYIQGETMEQFIQKNGEEWMGILLLQLLDDLEHLHQAGWVFGDLKADNLVVMSKPAKVRWVDVGGTTQMGRSIKEYTEFYDRGYWQMGTRRAEASYDLFALSMIFLSIYFKKQFKKGANPKAQLLAKLNQIRSLRHYRPFLQKALQGEYQSSAEMKQDVAQAMLQAQSPAIRRSPSSRSSKHHVKAVTAGKKGNPVWQMRMEAAGLFVLALFYYLSSFLLP